MSKSSFDPSKELDRLRKRIERVRNKHSRQPEMTSLAFSQLYTVWELHWLAAFRTVTAAFSELEKWQVKFESQERPDTKVAALGVRVNETFLSAALLSMDETLDALEAKELDQYLELAFSIGRSAGKIASIAYGGPIVEGLIAWAEAIRDATKISQLPTRKLRVAHDVTLLMEFSMRTMLVSAMLLEAKAGSRTGRFDNLQMNESERIRAWKQPVIDRLNEFRAEANRIFSDNDIIRLPSEGYWP